MHPGTRTRQPVVALASVLLMTLAMAGSAAAGGSGSPGSLAAIRASTARFHDLRAAVAAGYIPASGCEELPGVGAMGVHYLNPALAQDLEIDPQQPEVLLYAPTADGWRLVGVEYFAAALANTTAGPAPWFGDEAPPLGFFNPAPSILGQTFEGPMHGHSAGMPWHYDKHVWVWDPNPNGMFAQWNPRVSCG